MSGPFTFKEIEQQIADFDSSAKIITSTTGYVGRLLATAWLGMKANEQWGRLAIDGGNKWARRVAVELMDDQDYLAAGVSSE